MTRTHVQIVSGTRAGASFSLAAPSVCGASAAGTSAAGWDSRSSTREIVAATGSGCASSGAWLAAGASNAAAGFTSHDVVPTGSSSTTLQSLKPIANLHGLMSAPGAAGCAAKAVGRRSSGFSFRTDIVRLCSACSVVPLNMHRRPSAKAAITCALSAENVAETTSSALKAD